MNGTGPCRACGGSLAPEGLDGGAQPLCNRFLREPEEPEFLHPLKLGVCSRCGLLQLVDPVPAEEVSPRFEWITYQEPEGHLDEVVSNLATRLGSGLRVAGVSYKDDSTLDRLVAAGALLGWRLDPADLGVSGPSVEVDRVQAALDVPRARAVRDRRGPVDLLVVRHVLEHAHDLGAFLEALKALVHPHGRVVLEVPDATTMMQTRDYSPLWEEHLSYFTPTTLRHALERHGCTVEALEGYPYPLEGSLVAVVRSGAPLEPSPSVGATEVDLALAYLRDFPSQQARIREQVAREARHGQVAMLGAGHLGCMFLNLMGVGDRLAFVADDDPHRAGLRMPGSGLPILPSSELIARGVDLCLLAVNPLNEARVLARHQAFLDGGGRFASIFPVSPRALGGAGA